MTDRIRDSEPSLQRACYRTEIGGQLGSVGGPSRVEAGGWVCVRTSENDPDRGLPSSDFQCVNGSKKVTFRRL